MNQPHRRATGEPGTSAGATAVDSLVAALRSEDGTVRERARNSLVAIGHAAVTPLIPLLSDDHDQVRWEAAKALSAIRDLRAAEPLVAALEDEASGTRWVAAEGLIALGRAGLPPLIRALAAGAPSAWLRAGAHHVLTQMPAEGLAPEVGSVLEALEGFDPTTVVPPAAQAALAAAEAQFRATRRSPTS